MLRSFNVSPTPLPQRSPLKVGASHTSEEQGTATPKALKDAKLLPVYGPVTSDKGNTPHTIKQTPLLPM